MAKNITLSESCRQICVNTHRIGKDHQVLELRRFKNRLNQFLSMDDDLWLPAFQIPGQIENLLRIISKFKQDYDKLIVDKKLIYALNFDTERNLLKIFQQANSDSYQQLTCEDIALILKKIDKNRQPKANDIKNIIEQLINEEKDKLRTLINDILDGIGGRTNEPRRRQENRQRYIRQDQHERIEPVYTEHRNRGGQERRGQRRGGEGRGGYVKNQEKNQQQERPCLKIKDIQSQDHFDIKLKVLKIIKQFTIGNKRKIQFQGGDETGMAIIVVDSLRFIKPETVIHIKNAKTYSFHGTKQIQQSNTHSFVSEINSQINVSDSYNLSHKNNRHNRQGGERRYTRHNEGSYKQTEQRPQVRRIPRQRIERSQPQIRQQRIENNRQLGQRHDRRVSQISDVRQRNRQKINNSQRNGFQQRQFRKRQYQNNRQQPLQNQRGKDMKRRIEDVKKIQTIKKVNDKDQQRSGYTSSNEAEESEYEKNKYSQNIKNTRQQKNDKNLIKIKDLTPGMENLTFFAQIIQTDLSSKIVNNNFIFCIIGDQTGIVWAELPRHHPAVKANAVLRLKFVETDVHQTQKKIIIRLMEDSSIQKTSMRMPKINMDINMSQQQWQEDQQDGDNAEDDAGQEEKEEKTSKKQQNDHKRQPSKKIVEDF